MLELTQKSDQQLLHERERKTVLIVDDEMMIRDLCARALHDYQILQAADGEEALQLYAQGGVDVILTDIMMPKVDGLELLKIVKEREPTLVVIIMTGYADKELILKALKADADDFITKPLNLLQLKSAVDKALVKKALKEEIANLKSQDRFKTNFLSLVSHKFRTPITAISLFLQNLSSGIYDPEDDTVRENIDLVYAEACYLGKLVTDLLTFSQVMDTGTPLRLESCDLGSMLPKIMAGSKEWAEQKGVNHCLDLEPVPELQLDREKLGFAIRQVIDNAVKFSRKEGNVVVQLRPLGEGCQIVVEDDGIGIPQDAMPKIFDKFFQVDPDRTGQIRGFGLGLFYAREFIRMHGGSIALESQLGLGTRVTITLPAQSGAGA